MGVTSQVNPGMQYIKNKALYRVHTDDQDDLPAPAATGVGQGQDQESEGFGKFRNSPLLLKWSTRL